MQKVEINCVVNLYSFKTDLSSFNLPYDESLALQIDARTPTSGQHP